MRSISSIKLQELLLKLVPSDGSPISDQEVLVAMSEHINFECNYDDYLSLRDALVCQGVLGRSSDSAHGLVFRVRRSEAKNCIQSANVPNFGVERNLEPYVETYIRTEFICHEDIDLVSDGLVIQNTARGGRGATGLYSSPDILLANILTYEFSVTRELELFSFEIKTEAGLTAQSIIQAAQYFKHSHYSYLVWHAPSFTIDNKKNQSICKSIREAGVGLIVVRSPLDWSSYRIIELSRRCKPDLSDLDEVVGARFSLENQKKIKDFIGV